jgi:hypothetical protein
MRGRRLGCRRIDDPRRLAHSSTSRVIKRARRTRTAARIVGRLRRQDTTAAGVQAVYVCIRTARAGGGATGDAAVIVAAARQSRTERGCIEGRGRDRRRSVGGIVLVLVCMRVRDEVDEEKTSWTCSKDDWERAGEGKGSCGELGGANSEKGLWMAWKCAESKVKDWGSLDSAAWAWY